MKIGDKVDLRLETFMQMETKYSLFEYKTDTGIPLWDVLRYHVIWNYQIGLGGGLPPRKKRFPVKSLFNAFKILILSLYSLFFRKKGNILFQYARNLDEQNLLFDIVSENVIQSIGIDNILLVEKKKISPKYKYQVETNFIYYLIPFIFNKKYLPKDFFNVIKTAMENTFGEMKFTYKELNKVYVRFLKEYSYYRFYLKYKRAQKIFFIQNGIQKGLIYASNSLKIPIFELQHGLINKEHPAYNYPPFIQKNDSRIIAPDFFLTFSNIWGRGMNIPMKTVAIGNNFFAQEIEEKNDHSILFISSSIHGVFLSDLAVGYAKSHPDININFKLHSNEYSRENYYKQRFNDYANIRILKNEFPVKLLIARSSLVVLIESTIFYEALQTQSKVAVYKVMGYEANSEFFSLPNVYLFDNVEGLHFAYLAEKKESKVLFFDKFDKDSFNRFLNSVKL